MAARRCRTQTAARGLHRWWVEREPRAGRLRRPRRAARRHARRGARGIDWRRDQQRRGVPGPHRGPRMGARPRGARAARPIGLPAAGAADAGPLPREAPGAPAPPCQGPAARPRDRAGHLRARPTRVQCRMPIVSRTRLWTAPAPDGARQPARRRAVAAIRAQPRWGGWRCRARRNRSTSSGRRPPSS